MDQVCGSPHKEGPEGVKWELGFAYLFTGKMGFGSLGLGLTNNKMGMGSMSVHEKTYIFHAQLTSVIFLKCLES